MKDSLKQKLIEYYKKGLRFDGRKLDEYRKIELKTGVTASAEGSARVKIGKTDLIVGVKMAIEQPYPDTPDKGNLMVNAELMPLSSEQFEPGPPGEEAIELARVVDRGIRESETIDTTKLCIIPGEKVWSIMIDICTINADGNLLDAAALGTIAALKDAKFPKLNKDNTVNYEEKTNKGLPLTNEPIEVTVLKIGDFLIVDPLPQEEKAFDARLTVAVAKDGQLCALQKGGTKPLTIEELDEMVTLAKQKSTMLRKKLQ
ncbi:RNA-binding protein [Candidatus Woesearchaeota archaeon]|nr:MAG: RNA-binding protein [Candidatus Woesearchaeota archaeon ex4484_78]RLE45685.1 MAG: RNA-binding protein [Candidatus Woesearchaeota archaeon]